MATPDIPHRDMVPNIEHYPDLPSDGDDWVINTHPRKVVSAPPMVWNRPGDGCPQWLYLVHLDTGEEHIAHHRL